MKGCIHLIKDKNNGASVYVESFLEVHNSLIFVRKL